MMLIIDCKYRLIEKSHTNGFCGTRTVESSHNNHEVNAPLIQEETAVNGGVMQKVQIEEPVRPKVSSIVHSGQKLLE